MNKTSLNKREKRKKSNFSRDEESATDEAEKKKLFYVLIKE